MQQIISCIFEGYLFILLNFDLNFLLLFSIWVKALYKSHSFSFLLSSFRYSNRLLWKIFFVVVAHNCYKLPSWLFLLNTIDFCVLHFYFYFKKLLINFLDLFIYHEYISVLYVCIVSWLVIDWLLTGSFVILWSEKILVIIFAVRVAICKLKFCCLLHGKKSIGEDMF